MLEVCQVALSDHTDPVSHVFPSGCITVVLGRNNAGKTRLARVIAGLDPAAEGRVVLDGQDITGLSAGERSVSLVYQAFVNYPNWTVFENISSPLVARKMPVDDIRASVEDIAGRLGLTQYLDRLPQSLSGGQQQRLAIGRALAKSARVLVMDEPLVNLDYKLREALTEELRVLLHQLELAVVYTTTDPRDVFGMGDQVVLLADHELVQTGTPLEVYENPVSPRAADLMSDPHVNRRQGRDHITMIRPEHLHLDHRAEDDVVLEVEVLGAETNGSVTYLHCDVSGNHWVARLDGLVSLEPGDRRNLYAGAASVFQFPLEAADG